MTQVSTRRRSSSREARKRKTNYRLAVVAYVLVWVAAGIAIGWPDTEKCLQTAQRPDVLPGAVRQDAGDTGVFDAARACLPVAALNLLLWTLAGTTIALVVYYLLRRR